MFRPLDVCAVILLVICLWHILWKKESEDQIGFCTEGIKANPRIVLRECSNGENTVTAVGEFTFPEGYIPTQNSSSAILQQLNQATEIHCVQWTVAVSQINYSAAISLNTDAYPFDILEEPTILIKIYLSTIDGSIVNLTRTSVQQAVTTSNPTTKQIRTLIRNVPPEGAFFGTGHISDVIVMHEPGEDSDTVGNKRPEEEPLIRPRQQRKYTQRSNTYLCCAILSIIAGILVYATIAPVVHSYWPQQQTSVHEATCLSQCDDHAIPLVRLATVNAFEYYSVTIEQNATYILGVCYYLIPSDQAVVRNQVYSYPGSGYDYFGTGWYCLEGSSLYFHICLSAKNNDSGSSNLVLFNNYNEFHNYWFQKPAIPWMHYPLHVNGSETNCFRHNISVPHDTFVYYAIDPPTNAELNYSITVERRHLNATDWLDIRPVCFNFDDRREYAHYFSLFPPENSDYTLVAIIQYPAARQSLCNNAPAHVTLQYRAVPNKGIYIVLLIPIAGVSIIFSVICTIPCLYFKYRQRL